MAKKSVTVLCDSNVVIKFLRKQPDVLAELDAIGPARLAISIITTAEIWAGTRKETEDLTRQKLQLFNRHTIDEAISKRFVSLVFDRQNQAAGIPDKLIATTAIENGCELFTFNRKDFAGIKGLKFYRPKVAF